MTRLRAIVVVLLIWAAYWAALPWLDCARAVSAFDRGLELCSFGAPLASPARILWPNLVLGAVYLVVAALVAARRWRM